MHAIRSTPSRASAALHASAPDVIPRSPATSLILASNAALPSLPPQKRLGRHAHEDVIRSTGHDIADGVRNRVANQIEEVEEGFVAAEVWRLDEEPTAVERHPWRPHTVQIVFDDRVRRRHDHADLCSISDYVRHVCSPLKRRSSGRNASRRLVGGRPAKEPMSEEGSA